jgi:hypothetical protein
MEYIYIKMWICVCVRQYINGYIHAMGRTKELSKYRTKKFHFII